MWRPRRTIVAVSVLIEVSRVCATITIAVSIAPCLARSSSARTAGDAPRTPSGRSARAVLPSVGRRHCTEEDALFIPAEGRAEGFDGGCVLQGARGVCPNLKCSPGVHQWINISYYGGNGLGLSTLHFANCLHKQIKLANKAPTLGI